MDESHYIMTVQEGYKEAPHWETNVGIKRNNEGLTIEAGTAKLVGTQEKKCIKP